VVGVDSTVSLVFEVDERDLVVEESTDVATIEGEGRTGGVQVAGDTTVDLRIPEPCRKRIDLAQLKSGQMPISYPLSTMQAVVGE